ncbi:hypothetical protein SAMN05216359_102711 [Roseateles sp. YR242]|uniref:hypothetical protein n=1 Tax=Roseateles sp. YR242 TaxID=1855305 RepID=UPI0008AA9893|nr:hypothetical protein [Roseateles sp. YR242]SEK69879.1 hypothetical protein SAMN05216359_102711 [Roseateles sp. YR242]
MSSAPRDVAQIRLDNAMRLFNEFVAATLKHPDAAALRGLERRFAERLQIQPSYWSQIKGRSRQIGERLARQFEQLSHKPVGWMDQEHGLAASGAGAAVGAGATPVAPEQEQPSGLPQDDDERFIVGLVLTYYRRHPQRARTRLLDLLGEVLTPGAAASAPVPAPAVASGGGAKPGAGTAKAPVKTPAKSAAEVDEWRRLQQSVAPLKAKKR